MLVIKEGNGQYTVNLDGLSFKSKPNATLPNLDITSPSTYSHRISSSAGGFTITGNSGGALTLFALEGSTEWETLEPSFSKQVNFSFNEPVYNYYAIQTHAMNGNRIYRTYEIIWPGYVRVDGSNRYDVAINASKALTRNREDVKSVVITRGDTISDIIAGGPLAGLDEAPILLTPSSSLYSGTKEELRRLNPEKAYIVGGTGSIHATVEQEIKNLGIETVRITGANRYEASVNAAKELTNQLNVQGKSADTAFIVNGFVLTDAAAGLSVAINRNIPILYVAQSSVPTEVEKFIKDNPQYKKFKILGGTATVSDAVSKKISSLSTGNQVDRIGGSNRFETAINLIKHFNVDTKTVVIGRGDSVPGTKELYPDVVVGAPLAAKYDGAILLTLPGRLEDTTRGFLNTRHAAGFKVDQGFVQGGSSSVSDDQLFDFEFFMN
ncbi:cell wall-binding repeat-containing protein [Hazenella sp. IB182353]|uniref:cell wall-binding repeat-containing protein n=1 Tax=Polycladospora coralii TaxID=2771432 RepID=UPI00174786B7|nr:cell wall-binding repeat-containing protein [Polycladospora coralii]MBS7531393.1 cell wall-binding repeat-containing protein [Polycladospora coralii]